MTLFDPKEVGGMVERLRETHTCDGCGEYVGSQVTTLLDEAATALTTERADHAETKRERDELAHRALTIDEALTNAVLMRRHFEAQRDEALKALDEADAIIEEMVAAENEWQCNPADDERIASVQSRASVYLAARRVREGGKADVL